MPDGDVMDQFEQVAADATEATIPAFLAMVRERLERLAEQDGEPPAIVVLIGGTNDLLSSRMDCSDAVAVYMLEAFKLGLFGHLEGSEE